MKYIQIAYSIPILIEFTNKIYKDKSWNNKIEILINTLKYNDLYYLKKKLHSILEYIPHKKKYFCKKDKLNWLLSKNYNFYTEVILEEKNEDDFGCLPKSYINFYDAIKQKMKQIEIQNNIYDMKKQTLLNFINLKQKEKILYNISKSELFILVRLIL
jgi:hypothetical protein